MIFKYTDFINEVKSGKLNLFRKKGISELFTSSIEIELETEDLTDGDIDYSEKYVNEIVLKIKNSVIKHLLRIDEFTITEEIQEFIETILNEVRYEWEDYEYLVDEILEEESYEGENKLIVQLIKPQVLSYFYSDDFNYLENQFKSNFKDFYKKYKSVLKFELDNTLNRGIELSNLTYFNSIDDLIGFIQEFYDSYSTQKYWKFTENTGIHINIGLKESTNYNIIKGLLFLNDTGDDPFVFKNMEWRKNSKFCGSLTSELTKEKSLIEECKKLMEDKKISDIENILNDRLIRILNEKGYKNYGVNLIPLKRFNYIEFRYPGGEMDKINLIDKLLYFTYVVHLMTNFEYDRNIYLKKLYKFLENK
jgi:hypothetical protein